MSKKKILAILTGTATVATAIAAYEAKKKADKTTYEANLIEPIKKRKRGIYEKYIKRALDVICATGAIVVFSPVYLGVAVLVKLKLGSPVLFTQDRPGLIGKDGRETVFKMYKFRTMTDERDENGELLPDEARLTKFGKWLRNTSLDELPEAFNILNGTMSVIGPRPQLVRDISNLFFVLCLLNLVCILYNSQLFGMDTYLIGIKNQIGYALNMLWRAESGLLYWKSRVCQTDTGRGAFLQS